MAPGGKESVARRGDLKPGGLCRNLGGRFRTLLVMKWLGLMTSASVQLQTDDSLDECGGSGADSKDRRKRYVGGEIYQM